MSLCIIYRWPTCRLSHNKYLVDILVAMQWAKEDVFISGSCNATFREGKEGRRGEGKREAQNDRDGGRGGNGAEQPRGTTHWGRKQWMGPMSSDQHWARAHTHTHTHTLDIILGNCTRPLSCWPLRA